MSIRYVGALVIQAGSPKRLADWYTKYLGLEVTLEHQEGYFGAFSTERGPFHFGIVPVQGDPAVSGPGQVTITFRVDNFNKLVERFRRDGNEPIALAQDDEELYAMFRDPEGNRVSIWGE